MTDLLPSPRAHRSVPDLGVLIALVWIMVAVAVTVLYGELLGLRGWIWLSVHHVACGLGSAHELRRGWIRRRARLTPASAEPSPPA